MQDPKTITMTPDEWQAEGERRFGPDIGNWKFVCPACGIVTSIREYKAAGAPVGHVAFSCIGRTIGPRRRAFGIGPGLPAEGPGPCDYTSGGLFCISPIKIVDEHYFAFAEPEENETNQEPPATK